MTLTERWRWRYLSRSSTQQTHGRSSDLPIHCHGVLDYMYWYFSSHLHLNGNAWQISHVVYSCVCPLSKILRQSSTKFRLSYFHGCLKWKQ